MRKSAVKNGVFTVSGRSETKRNPANYAQKCGKKRSFAVSGRSKTGRNPANYAQKCGKNCVLLGQDVLRPSGILRTMRKSAVKN